MNTFEKIKKSKLLTIYGTQTSAFIAVILLGAALSILTESFFSSANILTVMMQASVNALLGLGATFVMITGNIDLAAGAVLALCANSQGWYMMNNGLHPLLAILFMFLIGIGTGAISAGLMRGIGMPAFIATLGGTQIWRGIALVISNGSTSFGYSDIIKWFGKGKLFATIPVPIIIVLVMYFLAWFLLKKTTLGLSIYAIGGNKDAAQLSGINVTKTTFAVYIINGFLCALAGLVLMARMDSATGIMADSYEMDAIASSVIGGVSMTGGEGNVWGTLIGALLLGIMKNGLNLLGVSAYWQKVATGLIIVIAVTIDCMRKKGTSNR